MLHKNTEIKKNKMGELAIFATALIEQGEIVWQISSSDKIFSKEEALNLPIRQRELVFKYKDKYALTTDNSQYMNHSCNPNFWFIDDATLVAKWDIKQGGEITYDYSTTEIDPVFIDEWRCLCGSENCRGRISPNDCLKKEFQELHAGHLPSSTVEFINRNKKSKFITKKI
ncbi:MAG: Nuclear protein SET [Candidatus Moranbacteria bacterium GW2011_GWE1_35_17]|nr:MAG: Nuclear protein SET [Candidatus Moranbacteria bacterium GW2011_GWE1_35_17]KKP80706.1 MAG: Nuclear protein SET [Candidatus Moranbacteria bacterium GW2011_GWF1_35_5]KKP84787.1 MAG: Nuclear protein SET [Candidatus Moranbacteria bacterium GW2011_GWF2_35_54]